MKKILIFGAAGSLGSRISKELIKSKEYFPILVDQKKIIKPSQKFDSYVLNLKNIKKLDKTINKIFFKHKEIYGFINCLYFKNKTWTKNFELKKDREIINSITNHLSLNIIYCKKLIKFFKKQKESNIILFGSIQSISAPNFDDYKGTKIHSPIEYTCSKFGLVGLTKYIAKLYGPKGIKINLISPGGIKNNQNNKFIRRYRSRCLTKGLLDPKDITETVKFLLSQNSKYINGQNIVIDDGWSL